MSMRYAMLKAEGEGDVSQASELLLPDGFCCILCHG